MTLGVDGQVRPTGRVAIDRGTTVSSQAVIGAVRREIAERRAERATGMDEKRWQTSLGPYLERTFATGRFPALATVVRDAAHLDADHTFRIGLDFLLDGIEARISR